MDSSKALWALLPNPLSTVPFINCAMLAMLSLLYSTSSPRTMSWSWSFSSVSSCTVSTSATSLSQLASIIRNLASSASLSSALFSARSVSLTRLPQKNLSPHPTWQPLLSSPEWLGSPPGSSPDQTSGYPDAHREPPVIASLAPLELSSWHCRLWVGESRLSMLQVVWERPSDSLLLLSASLPSMSRLLLMVLMVACTFPRPSLIALELMLLILSFSPILRIQQQVRIKCISPSDRGFAPFLGSFHSLDSSIHGIFLRGTITAWLWCWFQGVVLFTEMGSGRVKIRGGGRGKGVWEGVDPGVLFPCLPTRWVLQVANLLPYQSYLSGRLYPIHNFLLLLSCWILLGVYRIIFLYTLLSLSLFPLCGTFAAMVCLFCLCSVSLLWQCVVLFASTQYLYCSSVWSFLLKPSTSTVAVCGYSRLNSCLLSVRLHLASSCPVQFRACLPGLALPVVQIKIQVKNKMFATVPISWFIFNLQIKKINRLVVCPLIYATFSPFNNLKSNIINLPYHIHTYLSSYLLQHLANRPISASSCGKTDPSSCFRPYFPLSSVCCSPRHQHAQPPLYICYRVLTLSYK
jgi:hypothetical protein